MILQVKKLNENAILPCYAHEVDAGLDLFSIDEKELKPREIALIKTGIAIKLDNGYEAQIRSRSGLSLKHGIIVLNSPATIDSGYRGEIGIIICNLGNESFKVEKGMKIAQMVIAKYEQCNIFEVEELDDTQRGSGAFGSSGLF